MKSTTIKQGLVYYSVINQLMICNEIHILSTLINPGILTLYEVFSEPDRLILVSELLEGRDLYSTLVESKRHSERLAAAVINQTSKALKYLHRLFKQIF